MMDALKGGNTYGECCSQDMEKQSIIDASGSGFQDEYGLKRLFKREANMSIDGIPICVREFGMQYQIASIQPGLESSWKQCQLEC